MIGKANPRHRRGNMVFREYLSQREEIFGLLERPCLCSEKLLDESRIAGGSELAINQGSSTEASVKERSDSGAIGVGHRSSIAIRRGIVLDSPVGTVTKEFEAAVGLLSPSQWVPTQFKIESQTGATIGESVYPWRQVDLIFESLRKQQITIPGRIDSSAEPGRIGDAHIPQREGASPATVPGRGGKRQYSNACHFQPCILQFDEVATGLILICTLIDLLARYRARPSGHESPLRIKELIRRDRDFVSLDILEIRDTQQARLDAKARGRQFHLAHLGHTGDPGFGHEPGA